MITRMNLKNFKCFSDACMEFSPLTLLSGINGSGKSTIIQILLLLRQSHLQGRLETQGINLHGDLIHLGLASDALSEAANEDEVCVAIHWMNDLRAKWLFDASEDLDYLPLKAVETSESNEVFKTPLFSRGFNYLVAERIGPRVVQQKNDFAVKEFRSMGNAGEYTAHFLAIHGREIIPDDIRLHKGAPSNSLLSQTEAWLSEIKPQTRLKIEEYYGTDQVRITYSSEVPSGTTRKFRATNEGFGLSFVLPVIVALLSAKPGDIIIIDTPEAHLHPSAQSKIGELLSRTARSGVQVLIETHSDHILNGVRLAIYDEIISPDETRFHYLTRILKEGDFITEIHTPEIDSAGRFKYWPPCFFDEWNLNLQRLLLPKEIKYGD
ncbi:DUF3696 domain-containing protein [Desulfobacterales bacterium HSG2]|nr:DUF3696 domain-containing protein [Desulfobacterales bacterium HSG2]